MGQLIKMKSYNNNGRNVGAGDLSNIQNVKGNYQGIQIAHTQVQNMPVKIMNTEGDVHMGGSFDGRERV
jgi:hypothetical protein